MSLLDLPVCLYKNQESFTVIPAKAGIRYVQLPADTEFCWQAGKQANRSFRVFKKPDFSEKIRFF